MDAVAAYEALMGTVRGRFLVLDVDVDGEGALNRAERFALHVRKTVEAVAFAALSATEHKNAGQLLQQRTKDASQLLAWLNRKKLLRLPQSQRLAPSTDPRYKAISDGRPTADLDAADLQGMFSRASALIHERHPERLSEEGLAIELQELERDARALRHWLWNHIVFLGKEGFLVQMGMFGSPSFMGHVSRAAPSN
ncbi:hypothetical protein [Ideonella sp.]|uniref:hypothetical protein n=1 Tax=Ideonella sp. TaxID=1929293 RepID=UPI0035B125FE